LSSTTVEWVIPTEYASDSQWDTIQVYGSSDAMTFTLLASIPSGIANTPPAFVTTYNDTSIQNPWTYYGIKLFNSVGGNSSHWIIAFASPSYIEMQLVTQLRDMLGTTLSTDPTTGIEFTDNQLLAGIQLGLNAFNIYPPVTCFTLDNFPQEYVVILLYLAQLFTLINKYLGMALNDFSYNDNGLSLNIDRGARINTAVSQVQTLINNLLAITKLEFAFMGESVGTLQLPVGIGGVISRGVSNLLDVFNSFGR
jgi:hypothetical protein